MQIPDFLTRSADGEICVSGRRIGLYHLVQRYNEGESAEMLASRYPTLPLALVHKALAFYLENQTEVDSYMAACSTTIDEQRDGARSVDVEALRRRLANRAAPAPEVQVG